jgi:hypothetical protein
MLSFLYRLVRAFRDEHGYRPNVVVMNTGHYRLLQKSLPELANPAELAQFLAMDVLLSEEAVHPHVAWMPQTQRVSAGR